MSALSDAARNVEWAAATLRRELENPTEWVGGEHGCDDRESKRLVDNLIAAVRAHDAALVRNLDPDLMIGAEARETIAAILRSTDAARDY